MTKPIRANPSRRLKKSVASRVKAKPRSTSKPVKSKTLAEINRWMEENADAVMIVARKNTLLLTGKELL